MLCCTARFLSHLKDEAFRQGGSAAAARSFLASERRLGLPDLEQPDFSGAVLRFARLAGQPLQEVSLQLDTQLPTYWEATRSILSSMVVPLFPHLGHLLQNSVLDCRDRVVHICLIIRVILICGRPAYRAPSLLSGGFWAGNRALVGRI